LVQACWKGPRPQKAAFAAWWRLEQKVRAAFLFRWAAVLMLLVHIMEIIMWAGALRHLGLIPRVRT
jgi:hypothetical protein